MAKARILPVFIPHRGCPHQCVFCDQKSISGQTRPPEPSEVEEMLAYAAASLPPGQEAEIAFYGGSFTAMDRDYRLALLDVADFFAMRQPGITIRFSTRPDAISEDILSELAPYPISTIELGVQSMDEEVLRRSGRGHSPLDAVNAARLVKAAGYRLILQMMTGLPGDSGAESVETAMALADLKPDGVRIYPTVVVKDTPLYDLWKAGKYKARSIEETVELCAVLAEIFEKKNIPIIRLGLNPTEELSGGLAVAGAYHPALGELVYGRVFRNRAEKLLAQMEDTGEIEITVPRGKVSFMAGQKKCNSLYLREKFAIRRLKITECSNATGISVKNIAKNKEKSYN